MPHPRQLIREAAKAALLNKTAAGDRVVETRMVPWRLPDQTTGIYGISIYTLTETVDTEESAQTAPRELTRELQLAIEAAVEATDSVDDKLDALCLEIERAMHADDTLGDKVADCILASTEIDVSEEGNKKIAAARLTYSVTYYTFAPDAADVPLEDFLLAGARYNLANAVHPDNEARDEITLPQD